MFDDNRRKYPRANYPCHLTMWFSNGSNETIFANTSNLGSGGLAVHLHQDVELGARVDIELNFLDMSTSFRCQGVVVRSQRINDKFYNIGIQFEPLGEIKYAFLEGRVSELIELEKKGKS